MPINPIIDALLNALVIITNSWKDEDDFYSVDEREQYYCSETSGLEAAATALRDKGFISQREVEAFMDCIDYTYRQLFDKPSLY